MMHFKIFVAFDDEVEADLQLQLQLQLQVEILQNNAS